MSDKIKSQHLNRKAILYVRQSTSYQVSNNLESQRLQYAMETRVRALGWNQVEIIDEDLGRSAVGTAARTGFERMVAQVCLGEVGAVCAREVSRFARNSREWQQLVEVCRMVDTLLIDQEAIYSPRQTNDRLLLGLKGTMSEAEVHVLKARLLGGLLNKARRGELVVPLPIGLVYDATGAVALDPDRQIQNAVRLLFDTFRETGSARATLRRFQSEGLPFPRRTRSRCGTDEVNWAPLEHFRVLQILHNPRYTGAFVFGRTRSTRTVDLKLKTRLQAAPEDWMVLIRDAHPGYISWQEFEHNRATLRDNLAPYTATRRGALPREGVALLQGHVLCGLCGARMRIRYEQNKEATIPYYVCTEESIRRAGKTCQSIRGAEIDAAVSELLLSTLAPAALKVALAVQDEIAGRIQQADALRQQQLERTKYDAELKRRRFFKCDPNHRLAADALEADWNEALRRLETLQQEHDRQRNSDAGLLNTPSRERILALARNLSAVWNNPQIEPRERKRMLALLIEDVTLIKGDPVAVHVRFRGGRTTSLTVQGTKPIALIRKFKPELITELNQLLDTCTDQQIAERFNARGYRNWQQQPFTRKKIISMRVTYKLKSRFQRLREQGLLTAAELARRFRVSSSTIQHWGNAGLLPRQHCDSRGFYLYEAVKPIRIDRGGFGGRMTPIFTRL